MIMIKTVLKKLKTILREGKIFIMYLRIRYLISILRICI